MEPNSLGSALSGLELIQVTKTYPAEHSALNVDVLNNITISISPGQFVSLVGPSGCGKSTLLRIICGLERATGGSIRFDGREVTGPREEIGLVFQEYALLPWRTTSSNIEFGLEVKGVPREERKAMSRAYVNAFGLKGFEDRYPRELSGGMQQRVAIARTLITNPQVVLMDEPFGSLDSQTRDSLQGFLLQVLGQRAQIVVFVTHNIDEALFLSDRIIALSPRPASVAGDFTVPLSRPRDRSSREYREYLKQIQEFMGGMKGEKVDRR